MKTKKLKSPQYGPRTKIERMARELSLEQLYQNCAGHTDFYKYTHPLQYPNDLEKLFVYGEARVGGKYPDICNFGLQMIINEDLMGVPTKDELAFTREHVLSAGGFDYFDHKAWELVRKKGYLPIEISALPEGLVVPEGTPLFSVRATEDFFAKSMNLLEPTLMHVWAPTTIASRILRIKKRLIPLFEKTNSMHMLPYAVNDFSTRSATCKQEAVRKGAASLLMFAGSDNMAADSIGIMHHYSGPQVLKSVWATEHSVAESFGPGEGEKRYILHQLRTAPAEAIVSIVIDTYNSRNFMYNIVSLPEVVAEIKKRPGRVVFRPDSGKMKDEMLMVYDALTQIFGFHIESDYKVLNENTGGIAADGVDENSAIELYEDIIKENWSCVNLVLGSGKGLMGDVSRDTSNFAIKANMGIFTGGREVPLMKSPAGSSFKRSKAGWIHEYEEDGVFRTITSIDPNYQTIKNQYQNLMRPKYRNGKLLIDERYENVVGNIDKYLFPKNLFK